MYLERYPHETRELLSCGKLINELALKGHDWALYDEQFRRLKQENRCAWTEVLTEVHHEAVSNSTTLSNIVNA